ncbi:hypothetical protein VTN77DRAFT_2857 [Rasamsonia byssochlamydoides]|uniref:uncharacterized protein n=1 Tax=Rasamsonia byssochlamydoides TaxID=89139 RepID=UPI0037432693
MHTSHSEISQTSSADEEKNVKDLSTTTNVAPKGTTRWPRRRIIFFAGLAFLVSGLVAMVITLPIVLRRHHSGWQSSIPSDSGASEDPTNLGSGAPLRSSTDAAQPLLAVNNFPDPGLLEYNGTWYAFGTNQKDVTTGVHIPMATSTNFQNWTLLRQDALPVVGAWELEINHWAPDVIRRDDGRFVLYYSGQAKDFGTHHCVGVAVSNGTSPLGPYHPQDQPLACPRQYGGAIDPSPFRDVDGKLYVAYKADGNSVGHGGNCNNGVYPLIHTPIMLQEMESDGVTPVGDPVEILDITQSDGPLVEAPRIIRTKEGIYFLTFSSHCDTSPQYNVKYATSTSVKGPYERAPTPLLQTGDYNLVSPGGASLARDGTKIVFHANCGIFRCMYAAAVNITHTTIDFIAL